MTITWTQFAKAGEPKNAGYGNKVAEVDMWHGRVGKMDSAVVIQGPSRNNDKWRVMAMLRWKDAIVEDHASLKAAKASAGRLVKTWLSESGLSVNRERRVAH